ncbi:MAG TPA: hypothetical protein PK264_10405 [Hyphomicrobiaceae bacterium]|nr:hypothetical protein [Hyphomicrobiaceae bacterium]
MKILISAIAGALIAISGTASAKSAFDTLAETAPKHPIFAELDRTAPRANIFDTLNQSAPKHPIFIELDRNAP